MYPMNTDGPLTTMSPTPSFSLIIFTSKLNILKIFARQNKISVEDYIDSLVSDYDLTSEAKRDIYFNGNYLVLHITDNLNVEVIDYASKSPYFISKDMVNDTDNYYLYIMQLKKEIKDQIQRFKDAFDKTLKAFLG